MIGKKPDDYNDDAMTTRPIILKIAVPSPLRQVFDYLPPDSADSMCFQPGQRIKVPFGRRQIVGVIIALSNHADCPANKLRAAIELIDQQPLLSGNVLKLCAWASDYYHHPIGDVIVGTLPKLFRQGRVIDSIKKVESLASTSISNLVQLTHEQNIAINTINDADGFSPYLLAGVTGSGKTEVYKHCVEHTLKQGKQALILVPEIALTPQTVQRFRDRFAEPVALLHSGLNDSERAQAWWQAKQGEAKIIIGTRSAIFAPMANVGLIVIDEEHDLSFKQQSGFRYSARDVAVMRAHIENIPIILGSATPSLETLHNVERERYQNLQLTQRIGGKMPTVSLVDIRQRPMQAGLSPELLQKIKQHVDANGQVMLFLNRRGYSPVLICHDCGYVQTCKRCDARMTLHLANQQMLCHHCGSQTKIPKLCPDCQHCDLAPLGVGTEQLEKVLAEQFPEKTLLRIDRDSTRRKNSMKKLLQQVHDGEVDILIGTQMLAKGHHFKNLNLVAIVDVDGGLLSSDFRAIERMAQLIMQVSGRAGRESGCGEVLLQTHQPEHPLLQLLLRNGYLSFAKALLQERKIVDLPPYSHFALLSAEATKQTYPTEFLRDLKTFAASLNVNTVQALGPVPALMERKAGKYRAQLLLQADVRPQLQNLLQQLTQQVAKMPSAKKVRWNVDVDPMEVL